MSESFPENWSYPAGVYMHSLGDYYYPPMVWVGDEPATMNDIVDVKMDPRSRNSVDPLSLCGKNDPNYTTITDVIKENEYDH